MRKRSKRYQQIEKSFAAKELSAKEAISLIKQNSKAKFDESVDVVINLRIDAKKSDQAVRGNVELPSGSPKKKRIAVFVSDDEKAKKAIKEGAIKAGGDDLIKEIKETGKCDFDIAVAEAIMMPKISKIAKILGPKGLMPNPKAGTISNDPLKTLAELQGGKVSFRTDEDGAIKLSIGKVSWDEEKLIKNLEALIEAANKAKPESVKQDLIKSIFISSTMGPSVRIANR